MKAKASVAPARKEAAAKKPGVGAAKKPAAAQGSASKASAAKKSAPASARSAAASLDWKGFFSPLDDRVLVARDGASDRTPGGLYIPDTATDALRPARGVVLAVGRGHLDKKGRLRPLDVRVNDCVLFEKHAGSEIKLRGEQLIVLREKDVLGIVQTLNGRA